MRNLSTTPRTGRIMLGFKLEEALSKQDAQQNFEENPAELEDLHATAAAPQPVKFSHTCRCPSAPSRCSTRSSAKP